MPVGVRTTRNGARGHGKLHVGERVGEEPHFSGWKRNRNAGGASNRPLRRHLRPVRVRKRAGRVDDRAEPSDADADERAADESECRRPAAGRRLYAVHAHTDATSELHLRTGRLRPRQIHARCASATYQFIYLFISFFFI